MKKIGNDLGIINKFDKDIKSKYIEFEVKYLDFNSIPNISVIENKFNMTKVKFDKFSKNNIIYEDFKQDPEIIKSD